MSSLPGIATPVADPPVPVLKPKERLRVPRACDICKKKKIRCTGSRPCQICVQDDLQSTYNAPYARGKRRRPSSIGSKTPSTRSSQADVNTTQPAQGSLELSESDRQGHFVGASSGLGFLLRLHRRLNANSGGASPTSVFNLGDPALPAFDDMTFALPQRHEAESLLKVYFELASPTYRFLHRPTVEVWLRQLYDNGSISDPHSHSKYAVVLSMFAQATRYTDTGHAERSTRGLLYYQAAEQQLALQTESATLISVQAFLGCCFFVLSCSRLNHCWSLFGTTSRLILALGLHRRKNGYEATNHLESELRKRLFWCAYNLDKYLSTILGRPCALRDDENNQELPSVVDDEDLTPESMVVAQNDNMNLMLGSIHHQKLDQILSKILQRLYGVKPLDRLTRYRIMNELGTEIEAWRRDLPAFLNQDKVDSRLLRPLFQRQSNLLTMAAGHAEILIFRPCLFDDFKNIQSEELDTNVQRCLNGSMSIVAVIDRMTEADQLYAASWLAHYQAFCAVAVLYTFTIKSSFDDPATWSTYFRAAERCQGMIAAIKNEDSLAKRFIVIMEEYRLEVVQKLQGSPGSTIASEASMLDSWRQSAFDLPNWEQLDSLALDLGDVNDIDLMYPEPSFGA